MKDDKEKKKKLSKEQKDRLVSSIYSTGKSLRSFCIENNISETLFYKKEYPSVVTIMLVCEKCGVSADYIIFGKK